MAKTSIQTEPIEDDKLKYLEFVRIAALHAVLCLCSFYAYAKENSGPLRPRVGSAERAARAVVEPFYARFRGVPLELLKVADRKVDDLLGEVNRRMPTLVKSASAKAYSAAQKAPEVARSVAGEVQRSGVAATAAGMARHVRVKYEPAAERYAVAAWRALNGLPLFPQAAQVAVPAAAYCAERYNRVVACAASQGCGAAQYLPMVPIGRIAKTFGEKGGEKPVPVPVAASRS